MRCRSQKIGANKQKNKNLVRCFARGEVRFDPIVRLPLTADMKLAWIDE